MKIKNISNKIIGIDSYTLLPDEIQDLPASIVKSNAVAIYKDAKFIEVLSNETGEAETEALPFEEVLEDEDIEPVAENESNADKLARIKEASDEEIAAWAKELGINPATCKTQADVRKKVKAALSK